MAEGNAWEEQLIADVRANGGRPSDGPLKGHPIAIMWTTGARSGERRRSIVTYSRDGDDVVIAGTNSGNTTEHPAWLANIAANPRVTVEVANETHDAIGGGSGRRAGPAVGEPRRAVAVVRQV